MNSVASLSKVFLIIASISACTAVALGAFAAHLLKDKLSPDLFAIFEVGVRYHMYHALALFAVAWCVTQFPSSSVSVSGWLFIAGTVVFSGSLYILSMTGMRWLGAITPLGGISFLAGWIWLAWCVWKEL
jgi:uncharacterized membrane protein YgdD (TMEM256/DUF423 family)